MVTTTYNDARRNDDGLWLCNVVDGCDDVATLQSTYACSTCGRGALQLRRQVEGKQRDLDEASTLEASIKEAASDREEGLTDLDKLVLTSVAMHRQQLGQAIEGLEAEAGRVEADHDHPVYACAQHEKALPKPKQP